MHTGRELEGLQERLAVYLRSMATGANPGSAARINIAAILKNHLAYSAREVEGAMIAALMIEMGGAPFAPFAEALAADLASKQLDLPRWSAALAARFGGN